MKYPISKFTKVGYSLKDIAVIQAKEAHIDHRADIEPMVAVCGRMMYPIFVAPMVSVTDMGNYNVWLGNKVTPVVPRSVAKSEENKGGYSFEERLHAARETFVSVSLDEAEKISHWDIDNLMSDKHYICVDIANGTMARLYRICKNLKRNYGDSIEIMTGNVANPEAYRIYNEIGIDYMRCSVGTGSCCTTACATGIYYPMATLLDDIQCERQRIEMEGGKIVTKVIADGGISNYDDIYKALAMGADFVMCGEVFAKSEEACGDVVYADSVADCKHGFVLTKEEYDERCKYFNDAKPLTYSKPYRNYYGMSTSKAQKLCGGAGMKTSEGVDRYVPVEYPIADWLHKMESYLRSNMSYIDCMTIREIRDKAKVIILGGCGDNVYRKNIE